MNDHYYLERLTVSELNRLQEEMRNPDHLQIADLNEGNFVFIRDSGELICFEEVDKLFQRIKKSIEKALEKEKLEKLKKEGRLKFVYPTGDGLETVQELIRMYQLDKNKIDQYLKDCIRKQEETSYYLISESLPLLSKLGIENGRIDMKYIRLVENIKLTLRNAMVQFVE